MEHQILPEKACDHCGNPFPMTRPKARFCSRKCNGLANRGGAANLLKLIDSSGDGCWEWTGYRKQDGYGHFRFNGKKTLAHRAAWIVAYGPIPDGQGVLHRCDNPPCCRPDHLFLGTDADNVADKVRKGRGAKGVNLNRSRSFLSDEIVIAIKNATGTKSAIARAMKIPRHTVSYARSGGWAHLDEAARLARIVPHEG